MKYFMFTSNGYFKFQIKYSHRDILPLDIKNNFDKLFIGTRFQSIQGGPVKSFYPIFIRIDYFKKENA